MVIDEDEDADAESSSSRLFTTPHLVTVLPIARVKPLTSIFFFILQFLFLPIGEIDTLMGGGGQVF